MDVRQITSRDCTGRWLKHMNAYQVATHRRAVAEYDAASAELYRAELALHDAHQSGVDEWVRAAGDHLHAALVRHYRAEAALGCRVA
jgi:hypothetical protein